MGDGCLEALLSLRHHQLCALKTTPQQLSEEGCPIRFRSGDGDLEAEDLVLAIRVDASGDSEGGRPDPHQPGALARRRPTSQLPVRLLIYIIYL